MSRINAPRPSLYHTTVQTAAQSVVRREANAHILSRQRSWRMWAAGVPATRGDNVPTRSPQALNSCCPPALGHADPTLTRPPRLSLADCRGCRASAGASVCSAIPAAAPSGSRPTSFFWDLGCLAERERRGNCQRYHSQPLRWRSLQHQVCAATALAWPGQYAEPTAALDKEYPVVFFAQPTATTTPMCTFSSRSRSRRPGARRTEQCQE